MGTVREFLSNGVEFVSVDPWLQAPLCVNPSRKIAYSCLSQPLSFIAATAEFLPFLSECFDWVHMRSMLDHVQVPDLALIEAWRVLKPGGHVLIGMYVKGGKSGTINFKQRLKDRIKTSFNSFGITRWKDYHVCHPTHQELVKLITDNGFVIEDTYWQPRWDDTVCYIGAKKKR